MDAAPLRMLSRVIRVQIERMVVRAPDFGANFDSFQLWGQRAATGERSIVPVSRRLNFQERHGLPGILSVFQEVDNSTLSQKRRSDELKKEKKGIFEKAQPTLYTPLREGRQGGGQGKKKRGFKRLC